jgi:hypothetical protein
MVRVSISARARAIIRFRVTVRVIFSIRVRLG